MALPPEYEELLLCPVPLYTEEPGPSGEAELAEDEMGAPDNIDVKVKVAELRTELKSVTRELNQMRQSHDRNFERMTDALKEQAMAFNRAFDAVKSEFVTKADFGPVAFQVRFLWLAVIGTAGLFLALLFTAIGSGQIK